VQEITILDLPEMIGRQFVGGLTTRDPGSDIYQLTVFTSHDGFGVVAACGPGK